MCTELYDGTSPKLIRKTLTAHKFSMSSAKTIAIRLAWPTTTTTTKYEILIEHGVYPTHNVYLFFFFLVCAINKYSAP